MSWGARRLVLVDSLARAIAMKAEDPGAFALCDGPRRPGIDLVNSPAMLSGVDVAGRTLIMKTTNGTVAALASRDAVPLLCASFVNAGATARYLRDSASSQITYVPSAGAHADEDVACADYLAALLRERAVDPAPFLARAAVAPARTELERRVSEGESGVHADDVDYCLHLDAAPVVLVGTPAGDVITIERQP
jgi:2-phosphosulfolactate phosphatase